MSYYQGYTQEEIAAELNMPVGSVKTKIRSAIIELRKYAVVIAVVILISRNTIMINPAM